MRVFLSCHGASLFGGERVLLALARGLAARGHAVTLEFPHDGPAIGIAGDIDSVDVRLSGRPRLPRNVREGTRFFAGAPAAIRRLARTIRDGRYDLVWVNSIFNAVAGTAARLAGAAVVWHVHERNFPGAAGLAAAVWIRGCADIAVAISGFVAESLDRAGLGRKVRIVPNALLEPVPAASPRSVGPTFVVGCVGQFEPRKRVEDVVAALARLPFARAILVGDGKARRRIVRAVRDQALDGRIMLTGFQANVKPYYSAFDCVVIPSRDEPFGLVALEAMATGRPVIAARSGALPEVLDDAAIYYPLGDVRALAACIQRLRDEPALAETLRERGLRRVRAFSMDTMLDRVEEVAREVIELRRGR